MLIYVLLLSLYKIRHSTSPARLAQLVEYWSYEPMVSGSSPLVSIFLFLIEFENCNPLRGKCANEYAKSNQKSTRNETLNIIRAI